MVQMTEYILTHGKNGYTVEYGEIMQLADRVKAKYYFSSANFWMWKMFQLGFAYGKHYERMRRKRK